MVGNNHAILYHVLAGRAITEHSGTSVYFVVLTRQARIKSLPFATCLRKRSTWLPVCALYAKPIKDVVWRRTRDGPVLQSGLCDGVDVSSGAVEFECGGLRRYR